MILIIGVKEYRNPSGNVKHVVRKGKRCGRWLREASLIPAKTCAGFDQGSVPGFPVVIPADAGIQDCDLRANLPVVIPADAGIQDCDLRANLPVVIPADAGIQNRNLIDKQQAVCYLSWQAILERRVR